MRIEAQFDREQLQRAADLLRYPSDQSKNLRPAFDRMVEDFERGERELFDSHGGSAGLDWSPIKADTLRRHPEHQAPMVLSGALRDSLTRRGVRYSVRTSLADALIVGTKDPAGNLHQHKDGSRNPKRPVLAVTPVQYERWIGYLADHILPDDVGPTPIDLGV